MSKNIKLAISLLITLLSLTAALSYFDDNDAVTVGFLVGWFGGCFYALIDNLEKRRK